MNDEFPYLWSDDASEGEGGPLFAALIERAREVVSAIEMQIAELEAQDGADETRLTECRVRLQRAQEQLDQITSRSSER